MEQVIERIGLTLSGMGMPRMAARVFAAVLVSEQGRVTSAELAATLRISPAAVSQAVQYLENVGMIARDREPGRRRDHYRLLSEHWYEQMFTSRDRMLVAIEGDLTAAVGAIGVGSAAGQRLDETRRFFAYLRGELPKLIERWREREAASGHAEQA
ncbi:GbsR/MarR family transcriptional regulator [Spirilliplanes yamanashiensis]|uniref:Transcriptional regulator n=1 Tax=Spirilliplanes yamanashiensis TaxID=42233 RepID=A0A8J3Y7U2_9ACTN|nr:MarR family transcriptional regulator [Spirilliplanes yamanashiensis]MDP9816834.1 putative ArsR family transcriptional regulator [Spirilliplanes yamanashiensis]GIJ03511.1 transcriptional regulator [Spirilliplanes yamanashiensis]